MQKTLLRAGALSCALLASTCLTTPARAQLVEPAPVRQSIDGNGVDLFLGTMNLNAPALTIGQADQGLAYYRLSRGAGWTDNIVATLNQSGSVVTVSLGGVSDSFTVAGGTYTATEGNGASLSLNTGTHIYTYTRNDGTVIRFDQVRSGSYPFYANQGRAIDIVQPSGATLTFAYDSMDYCGATHPTGGGYVCITPATAYRVGAVRNSYGYQLAFTYGEIDPYDPGQPEILPALGTWASATGVTATNLAIASGASTPSQSFGFSTAGGVTSFNVTDPMSRTTSYRFGVGGVVAGITLPGSGGEDVTIAYSSGRVSSVTSGATGATAYASSDAGGVRTVTVTDALSHTTTYTFDIASQRMTSVTDANGHTTGYQYDGSGRVTRVTAPEGNYVQYTYDARGNVTETRAVAKGGTGLPDMVTSASYDASCANPVTCNQPNTTTDARGNVTDYTYDSTHGGVLTVTLPAPTGGGTRPQTRYGYSSLQAYFKNGAGPIVASGEPVYRQTSTSACASGTAPSCVGTAAETVSTVSYGPQVTGTGNNLLPVSTTQAAGDASLTATTAITYDDVGNPLTVDGPLSGSADTARFRYNAVRERIGAVGPDPDGGGALQHRAQRVTYNSLGQASAVETGNVASQSDGDWAAMTVLQRGEMDYDSAHRPVVQRLTSGGATYALAQTSYDSVGRVDCTAQRMNPAEFASLPSDACTLDTAGSFGPDRIAHTTYDNAGQVTKVETGYAVSGITADEVRTAYTDNGRVETVTDANGNLTTYAYDGHDRLSRTSMPDPSTAGTSSIGDYEALTYATATIGVNTVSTPLVSSRRLRDGTSIDYTYDNLGRLTDKNLPATAWYNLDRAYTYDNFGRLLTANGNSLFTFAYDALGRTVSEVNPFGTIAWQYDAAGRRTRMTWPDSFYVTYDHLVTGEVTAIRENGAGSGAGVLGTYAYDDQGRRTTLTRGNGTVTSYSYDAVSRLSGLTQNLNGSGSDVTFGYSYNPAGEIVSTTRDNDAYAYTGHANANVASTANGLNQLTTLGGSSVTHDDNGNVESVPAAGSLTGAATSYTYNAENALTTVTNANYYEMMPDSAERLFRYYDGSANRWIIYDGQRAIAETNATGSALARRFVPGPAGDEPLAWYDGVSLGTRHWYHADERGSVIAASDGSGNLEGGNPNRYDEYGTPQGSLTGRFGYTGQMWLGEVGLYHYRARAYNPAMGGRFMQTDPIGFGGGMNIYAYTGNNPPNFTDPMGLDDEPPPPCTPDGFNCVDVVGRTNRPTQYFDWGWSFGTGWFFPIPNVTPIPRRCVGMSRSGNDVTIATPVQFRYGDHDTSPWTGHEPPPPSNAPLASDTDANYFLNIFNNLGTDGMLGGAHFRDFSGLNGRIGRYNVDVNMSRGDGGLNAYIGNPLVGGTGYYRSGNLYLRSPSGMIGGDAKVSLHELGHTLIGPNHDTQQNMMNGSPSGSFTEGHVTSMLRQCGLE